MAMWVMAVAGRRAMPVLFTGRKPDDVAGADFLDLRRPTRCARPEA